MDEASIQTIITECSCICPYSQPRADPLSMLAESAGPSNLALVTYPTSPLTPRGNLSTSVPDDTWPRSRKGYMFSGKVLSSMSKSDAPTDKGDIEYENFVAEESQMLPHELLAALNTGV